MNGHQETTSRRRFVLNVKAHIGIEKEKRKNTLITGFEPPFRLERNAASKKEREEKNFRLGLVLVIP
jgi:hypothetical protein